MANIVTITNNYDNGVCDGFRIYTGTTFNGDPYVIPNTATLISPNLISPPYDLNVGNYEGPLYVFLEHCDFPYVTPPPQSNPKKQGGFQVMYIFIECPCPVIDTDCRISVSFTEFFDTDCRISVSFTEFIGPTPTPAPTATPQPTSTPQPTPTTDCDIDVSFSEFFESTPTPLPTSTPQPTPVPTSSPTPLPTATPTPTVDCTFDATFVEEINPPV
jgi:hypothetical protein